MVKIINTCAKTSFSFSVLLINLVLALTFSVTAVDGVRFGRHKRMWEQYNSSSEDEGDDDAPAAVAPPVANQGGPASSVDASVASGS